MRLFGPKKNMAEKTGSLAGPMAQDPAGEDPGAVREEPMGGTADRRDPCIAEDSVDRRVPDEPRCRKVLPGMEDTSDLSFGAPPASREPIETAEPHDPEGNEAPMAGLAAEAAGQEDLDAGGDAAEPLPEEMEDPSADGRVSPGAAPGDDGVPEYPQETAGWNLGPDPMGAAAAGGGRDGGAPSADGALAQEDDVLPMGGWARDATCACAPDGDPVQAAGDGEPADGPGREPAAQAVQGAVRFEPVVDVEPVPPDLTFASLSSIMNPSGGSVWIALVGDPGVGAKYEMEDALLKYGNCRVRQVDSVVADGAVQLVYRVMLRKEPVSGRLRENRSPLPYDVPCWRVGNEAVLYMSLQPNGNGVAPACEAVRCRIFDAVRGEDGGTTVTVETVGGAVIEGVPIDRLFLPGIGPSDQLDLSDDEICARLADGMPR